MDLRADSVPGTTNILASRRSLPELGAGERHPGERFIRSYTVRLVADGGSRVTAAPSEPSAEAVRRSFRIELLRAFPAGTIEAFGSTFLLLIALRHFDLSTGWKAMIVAGAQVGLLFAPVALTHATRRGMSPGDAGARMLVIGSVGVIAPLLWPHPAVFVIGCLVALTSTGAQWALLQTIYTNQFPAERRGRLLSLTIAAKFACSGLVAIGVGRLLGRDAAKIGRASGRERVCLAV